MKKILITAMMASLLTANAFAIERKPIFTIDTDAFASDTQVTPEGTGDNHIAFAWWVPNEFWESILSRDATTSSTDKKAMLDALAGVSLFAVVQADISQVGAFNFYSKKEIEESMLLSYSTASGAKGKLDPLKNIDPDLEVVLGVFKPILGAAMGNLGNNLHFYVLNDKAKNSSRLLDPYKKGKINIQLTKRTGQAIATGIELPINALFIPRKCPNGKDAHVSWEYCPWSGKKLEG